MIDYNKHDYCRIGTFTNVVNEIDKSRAVKDGESTIYAFIEPLISKLALRHPEWQIVGEDSWYNYAANSFVVKRFRIYEGTDEVGSVLVDTYRGEKIELRNSRIKNFLAKRNYMATKSLTKAFKLIEEHFGSKTMNERLHEGKVSVSNLATNKRWAATREFDQVMGRLAPALATYVSLHMAEVRSTLEAYGAPSSALDMLTEKNERRKLAYSIADVRDASVGTTVLLHGDRYVVVRDADPDNPVTLTASQLDDDVRAKLGILKIVGDEEIIESVGVRVNPTTFYLLP